MEPPDEEVYTLPGRLNWEQRRLIARAQTRANVRLAGAQFREAYYEAHPCRLMFFWAACDAMWQRITSVL